MREFAVWAPGAKRVSVKVGDAIYPMEGPDLRVYWKASVTDAGADSDYGFQLDDDPTVYPDPRSEWQPQGVHGLSRVYDQHAHEWHDEHWHAPPLASAILYEMHV